MCGRTKRNWRFAKNRATVVEYVVFCCASTDTLQAINYQEVSVRAYLSLLDG